MVRILIYSFCIVILSSACTNVRKDDTLQLREGPPENPVGMIWIPGGVFTMGCCEENCAMESMPPHLVKVNGFWMDETEVTNAQFKKFVDATGYITIAERPIDWEQLKKQLPSGTPKPNHEVLLPGALVFTPPSETVLLHDHTQWWSWIVGADWQHPEGPHSSIEGKDNYPVVQIAYEDAEAYATWSGKKLPTEAQFEFAARGGVNGSTFSWGNELNPQGKFLANYFQGSFPNNNSGEDGFKGLAPVRSFPANGYGLYDMIGNVWELCTDWYSTDLTLSKKSEIVLTDPIGPPSTEDPADPFAVKHVSKGGSFLCSVQYCSNYKPSGRQGTSYDSGMSHTGFRCIMENSLSD